MGNVIALIHTQCGPYHLARVRALCKIYSGEVKLIQLVAKEEQREWKVDNQNINLATIDDGSLTEVSKNVLTAKLLAHLKTIQPTVLVIAGYAYQPMRAAAQWAKKNEVLTIMLSDSHYLDKPRNLIIERLKGLWICKHFDAAFVAGASAALYLHNLGFPGNRIWRTYDVVDNSYFAEVSKEIEQWEQPRKKLQLPEQYFLYVGRLSPEKNLLRLLEAYQIHCQHMLEDNQKSWSLVLVGSGSQEHELKLRAKQLGLQNVCWEGFKQLGTLPYYYGLASALILPSTSEPWGLVVNEAMACSLPVLISDRCGCLLDLVFPGINGYVFNPFEVENIANALIYLNKLPAQQLQKMGQASDKIISNYTLDNWAEALADCARFLCQNNEG